MTDNQKAQIITFKDLANKLSLSPSGYEIINIKNNNWHHLRDLINGDLKKGQEVGSDAYIHKSNRFFFENKSITA